MPVRSDPPDRSWRRTSAHACLATEGLSANSQHQPVLRVDAQLVQVHEHHVRHLDQRQRDLLGCCLVSNVSVTTSQLTRPRVRCQRLESPESAIPGQLCASRLCRLRADCVATDQPNLVFTSIGVGEQEVRSILPPTKPLCKQACGLLIDGTFTCWSMPHGGSNYNGFPRVIAYQNAPDVYAFFAHGHEYAVLFARAVVCSLALAAGTVTLPRRKTTRRVATAMAAASS